MADPLDRVDVERPAVAGAVPGGVQPGDQLVVAGGRPEPSDQIDGGGRRAPGGAGWTGRPAVSSLVAPVCQRIPMRTWSGRCSGSRVTSAIRVRSSACGPWRWWWARSTGRAGQRRVLQVLPAGQRRQRVLGGLQRLLSLGQGGEAWPPSGLQGTGDQPVFRLDGAKRPLGPVGVIAGTFHREPGGRLTR